MKPSNEQPIDLTRYSRHLMLPEIGESGQRRLQQARVLVVGAGGLGCAVLPYLAAAGVGTLGIMDGDVVEISNLQRQVFFTEADVGRPKAEVLAMLLRQLNSAIQVLPIHEYLNRDNALELFRRFDIVVDATDNFPARYLINDAAVLTNRPFVYGAIFRFEGQVAVFNVPTAKGEQAVNYRDLFPEPPPPHLVPSCAEGGVLGVLPGLVGTIQATEVIKWITGSGELLAGEMLLLNALRWQVERIRIPADPQNPISGQNPSIRELQDYEWFCQHAGSETPVPEISPLEFARWQQQQRAFFLLDVRQPFERQIVSLGGTNIPEGELTGHLERIPKDVPVVVYCRSGIRSARVVQQLLQQGWPEVYNLAGGILAYIQQVQPDWPVY